MSSKPDHKPVHGRGAQSSALSDRFALPERLVDDDWREAMRTLEDGPPKLRTEVTLEHPKSILTFNQSPDIGFDRSINAYRGCEHGCVYCYARPTHAWQDLSPGLDFETKLFAKANAAELLRETLARRKYVPAPIAMGTNTDPYQPIERDYRITRQVLELCLETRHPVMITTKSDRVLDDIGLLQELAALQLVAVSISVTSLDPRLSAKLEPRAASPAKRLAALEKLSDAGIPTHCSVAPVIPAITDCFMEEIIASAASAGVRSAGWILLRLPHEVAPLFREWLDVHFPDRAAKVMGIVQSVRGGKDNDSRFFHRMRPSGVWAELFRTRFRIAARRAGLAKADYRLDCSQFRPPTRDGQLALF